jgi:hypothetical protein
MISIHLLTMVAVIVVVVAAAAVVVVIALLRTRTPPPPQAPQAPLRLSSSPDRGRYYLGAGTVFLSASNNHIVASSLKGVFTITGDMTIGVDNKYLDMTSFQWSNNTVYMPILSVTATKWEYETVPSSSRYRFWRTMSSGARVYIAVKRIGVDVYCVIGYTDSIPTETVDEFSIISI